MPVVSGAQAVKVFASFGWSLDHQSGSHMILYRKGHATLSVPNHRELAPELLRGLIRKSGLSVDEFVERLD